MENQPEQEQERLGIGERKVGFGNWVIRPHPQPQTPIPQSPIPNPQIFNVSSFIIYL